MKNISLNWYQRISLWARVGSMQTPTLKEASVCLRILDKIRPKEEEVQATKLTITEANYRWTLPDIDYGSVKLELEDEEANALANGLDNHPQPVMVADAAWMLELLSRLRADDKPQQEVIPAPKPKKRSAA